MRFEKEPIFQEMDYQENRLNENNRHQKLLLDQYNYSEDYFHILQIRKLIEETKTKKNKFFERFQGRKQRTFGAFKGLQETSGALKGFQETSGALKGFQETSGFFKRL